MQRESRDNRIGEEEKQEAEHDGLVDGVADALGPPLALSPRWHATSPASIPNTAAFTSLTRKSGSPVKIEIAVTYWPGDAPCMYTVAM